MYPLAKRKSKFKSNPFLNQREPELPTKFILCVHKIPIHFHFTFSLTSFVIARVTENAKIK